MVIYFLTVKPLRLFHTLIPGFTILLLPFLLFNKRKQIIARENGDWSEIHAIIQTMYWRVPPVDQELLTQVFSVALVALSLVFYVVFYRLLFVLLSFFFYPYCVVCPSSWIYGFILPLRYLQTLVMYIIVLYCY